MDRVIVVGGGIAGLSVAYFLRKAGATVTVLEARRVGSGASWGNAGWVTPAQAGPLPEPGLVSYGVRSVMDARSALYFQPRQLARMAPWLLRFARRCNEADHAAGRTALGILARRCFELLEEMRTDGVDAQLHRMPLLVASSDPRAAQTFLDQMEPLAQLGFRIASRLLAQEEILELEPALSGAVRTGFVIEQHCVVESQVFVRALRARLVEVGVEILEGAEVRDVEIEESGAVVLRTSAGRHRCERAVLAGGAWTAQLARMFGARLPIEGGKGYSFEVTPKVMPRHALLLLDPHVGCSPLGDRLRIAGTMEFSGLNARLDRRRIDSIAAGASKMIQGWREVDEDSLWSGLRPIAPDGLPIIDRHARIPNVFFAGAYSMLGMTLAAPAGEALASFVLTGERPPVLEAFRADRFGVLSSLRRSPVPTKAAPSSGAAFDRKG